MSTVSAEAREYAGKVAAEIRRRGWYQGDYKDIGLDFEVYDSIEDEKIAYGKALADCSVCALGGVLAVDGLNALANEDLDALPLAGAQVVESFIERIGGEVRDDLGYLAWNEVAAFNDAPGRSVNEVLSIFDAIARGDSQ